MEHCCLCFESTPNGKPVVTLTSKSSDGVNRASQERGNSLKCNSGDVVHVDCRRWYTKPDNIARDKKCPDQRTDRKNELRSANWFNFQDHCLFCGQPAKFDKKRKDTDVSLSGLESSKMQYLKYASPEEMPGLTSLLAG